MTRAALCFICALALPLAAGAQELLQDLRASEKRFVQAALALAETYDGLLDGAFGARSQSALDRYVAETGAASEDEALATALSDFAREWRSHDWRGERSPSRVFSYVAPSKIPEGLRVEVATDGNQTTDDRHAAILSAAVPGSEPYELRRDHFRVTSVESEAGGRIYLRSNRQGSGGFDSIRIDADAANRGRLQLIASSVSDRANASLDPPTDGSLAALFSTPAPAIPRGMALGLAGNVLAAARTTVEGCGPISLSDGTDLQPLSVDDGPVVFFAAQADLPDGLAVADAGALQIGADLMLHGLEEPPFVGRIVVLDLGGLAIGGLELLVGADPPPGAFTVAVRPEAQVAGAVAIAQDGTALGVVIGPATEDAGADGLWHVSDPTVLRRLVGAAGGTQAGDVETSIHSLICSER